MAKKEKAIAGKKVIIKIRHKDSMPMIPTVLSILTSLRHKAPMPIMLVIRAVNDGRRTTFSVFRRVSVRE